MFRWHKEIKRLDIPAERVLHLERALSPVQVALPGLPSQEATAYLCVFSEGKGMRTSVVFLLQTSRQLAFYLNERVETSREKRQELIEEGIRFAESMGFTLTNLDYQELSRQEQSSFWKSLPLCSGIAPCAPEAAASPGLTVAMPRSAPPDEAQPVPLEEPVSFSPEPVAVPAVEQLVELEQTVPPDPAIARRVLPGSIRPESIGGAPSTRKRTLSADEMAKRRQKLLDGLGRFLASM